MYVFVINYSSRMSTLAYNFFNIYVDDNWYWKNIMNLDKDRYGYYHELLDRLHCMCEIFDVTIINHDSNDILSSEDKNRIISVIADAYQLVGNRICEVEE